MRSTGSSTGSPASAGLQQGRAVSADENPVDCVVDGRLGRENRKCEHHNERNREVLMSATVGHWRARYSPGRLARAGWTDVAGGPRTAAGRRSSAFIDGLWEHVVDSASMPELATRLAAFKIDGMPSFAAFFWTEDGMRSLVRGSVTVGDSNTGTCGRPARASRPGARSGSSRAVAHPSRKRRSSRRAACGLPLVVGAVRASTIELDAPASTRGSARLKGPLRTIGRRRGRLSRTAQPAPVAVVGERRRSAADRPPR